MKALIVIVVISFVVGCLDYMGIVEKHSYIYGLGMLCAYIGDKVNK